MTEVIVTIGEDGTVSVEAKCVKGKGCAALTQAIEAAIGRTTADLRKPEYHQQATIGASAKAGR